MPDDAPVTSTAPLLTGATLRKLALNGPQRSTVQAVGQDHECCRQQQAAGNNAIRQANVRGGGSLGRIRRRQMSKETEQQAGQEKRSAGRYLFSQIENPEVDAFAA